MEGQLNRGPRGLTLPDWQGMWLKRHVSRHVEFMAYGS